MSLIHPLLYAAIMVCSIFGSESNLVVDMKVNPWYFDKNYGMDLVNIVTCENTASPNNSYANSSPNQVNYSLY